MIQAKYYCYHTFIQYSEKSVPENYQLSSRAATSASQTGVKKELEDLKRAKKLQKTQSSLRG